MVAIKNSKKKITWKKKDNQNNRVQIRQFELYSTFIATDNLLKLLKELNYLFNFKRLINSC